MYSFWKKKTPKFEVLPRTWGSERIYLDYAAATPVCSEAVSAMANYQTVVFGNASSIHKEGREAKAALTEARARVAQLLQIQPSGVVFTSGGTEGNNLAIRGVVESLRKKSIAYNEMEIITTKIEHTATLGVVAGLAELGVVVHYIPVDAKGRIVIAELRKKINKKTILVCVSFVNSEIGTIENIGLIQRTIKKATAEECRPLLYVDAAQAPLWLPCELSRHKVDIMTFDASKFCGPKGIGILAYSKDVEIEPIILGGGQEFGLRPGTEPVSLIVGCVIAFSVAQKSWQARGEAVQKMRDYFINSLTKAIPTAVLNGARDDGRVANNVNISIPGMDSEFAVVTLDVHGVAISTKSACSGTGGGESSVVRAVTDDSALASSTLRFTLGEQTTKKELNKVTEILSRHVKETNNL